MQITIPCNVYSRMAELPATLDPSNPRQYLRCLYFERKSNQLYCVATNARCAGIEYLGRNEGPDEFAAVVIDQQMIKMCETEAMHNGNMTINANELLRFTTIETTFGGTSNGFFHLLPDENEFQRWRKWLPDEIPTQSYGTMYWNTPSIYALSCASRTGGLKFPQHIDVRKPVLINDADSSEWIGVFMPTQDGTQNMLPVLMPDWL